MKDQETNLKVIAMRLVVSSMTKHIDEYAALHTEYREKKKTFTEAERKDLGNRLHTCMLKLIGQSHIIGCRFLKTMIDTHGHDAAMTMALDAMTEAHEGNGKEVTELHEMMKGHGTWVS
jgi:hypothetical protein